VNKAAYPAVFGMLTNDERTILLFIHKIILAIKKRIIRYRRLTIAERIYV